MLSIVFISIFASISILIVISLLIAFIVLFEKKKNLENHSRNVLSFVFDREKRRIRLVDLIPLIRHDIVLPLPRNILSGFWIPIREFENFFKLNKDEIFITKLNNLNINNNISDLKVNLENIFVPTNKNQNIFGDFKLIYEDESTIHCILSYKIIEKEHNKSIVFTSKEELLKKDLKYAVFFGFNVEKNHLDFSKSLIRSLVKMLHFQKFYLFQSRSVVVIVFESSKLKRLERKERAFLDLYEKKGKRVFFLDYFFHGLGYVEAKSIKTEEDINKVLRRLQFSITESIRSKEIFGFKLRDVNFSKFNLFKKNILDFYLDVQNKKVSFKYLNISKMNSKNSEISKIIVPKLNNEEGMTEILLNENNRNIVLDAFFEKFFLENNLFENTFYFLNDYQLVKHYEKLKLNRNIFILKKIDIKNFNEISNIFTELEKEDVRYGIYVEEIDPALFSLINTINPKYLFISEKIATKLGVSENIFGLLDLANVAKKRGIVLVYENPDFNINEKQKKSISLKYYYTWN
ncbi:MHO_4530 family protein [[Mycoplasma] mobile]|uniref:Expressed protein n=1 Tax=Mycoplasma mobile (strain ATCC 43663 / 163K / NCTC 11711) TaxID=267748 RepID=Q6KHF4_MYCM1|nr:hypothetical protein [[Mycoplasma] mobile]AAT27976.1 expressed protein [Mycoplasma mobile 163K]